MVGRTVPGREAALFVDAALRDPGPVSVRRAATGFLVLGPFAGLCTLGSAVGASGLVATISTFGSAVGASGLVATISTFGSAAGASGLVATSIRASVGVAPPVVARLAGAASRATWLVAARFVGVFGVPAVAERFWASASSCAHGLPARRLAGGLRVLRRDSARCTFGLIPAVSESIASLSVLTSTVGFSASPVAFCTDASSCAHGLSTRRLAAGLRVLRRDSARCTFGLIPGVSGSVASLFVVVPISGVSRGARVCLAGAARCARGLAATRFAGVSCEIARVAGRSKLGSTACVSGPSALLLRLASAP
ncbi:MAG: hypothetical protein ABSG36_15670 [Acidimicrobiales bacterium]